MDIYDARAAALTQLIKTRFDGNQRAFAEETGISPSYVTRMLKGEGDPGRKRIGEDMARRIEDALGLAGEPLVSPAVDRDLKPDLPPVSPNRDKVPEMFPVFATSSSIDELNREKNGDRRRVGKVALAVMDVRASMGYGAVQPSHENIVMSMVVDESWLRRHATFSSPDTLALVTGIGDSMNPTFEDGDPLLVDRSINEIKLDAVYVLALNDELYIKRVQRRPDGAFVMISDNKSYDPYVIKNGDREKFSVLGRVVMVWRANRI